MKSLSLICALLATSATAAAQSSVGIAPSTVVGIDLRGTDHMFTSDTDNFVTNWVQGPDTSGQTVFAMDFDASATTLWGINYDTAEYGTIDPATGVFTTMGPTNLALSSTRGLTAHPNGSTWYVMAGNGNGESELWTGDITTGVFSLVGVSTTGVLIDIACGLDGSLYCTNISDESLWSVDPNTGAGTLLGPLGPAIGFAQGMDFDWATGTLYAALYTGGGTGLFASLSTVTGAIIASEVTDTLNAEMEMAVQAPAPPFNDVGFLFCNPNELNSTGMSTTLRGDESAPTGTGLHLRSSQGPAGELGYYVVGIEFSNPGIPLGNGRLCLNPNSGISRYNVAGDSRNSTGMFNAAGEFENMSGTSYNGMGFDVPSLLPVVANTPIMAGETWCFQLWHRDTPAGVGSSNFSNGLRYTFN